MEKRLGDLEVIVKYLKMSQNNCNIYQCEITSSLGLISENKIYIASINFSRWELVRLGRME